MAKRQTRRYRNYVAQGNRILQAAAALDTRTVKVRLGAFQRVHHEYVSAQAEVDQAKEKLRLQHAVVVTMDRAHDGALGELASSLAGDGLPRINPFRALGRPAPSLLAKLGRAEEVQTTLALVQAVRARSGLSQKSLKAALLLEKAGDKLSSALGPLESCESLLRLWRQKRDDLAGPWQAALDALKRGARAAEDEGAPHLYGNLFGSTSPASKPHATKPAVPVAAALP